MAAPRFLVQEATLVKSKLVRFYLQSTKVVPTQILTDFSNRSTCWGFESRLLCRLTFVSNVNKLVDILTYRIPYLLLKTSKLLSLYTFKRKTSQGTVKKVCRYNGQLVQVQWTFGQNHEIILSTVLAFDCI